MLSFVYEALPGRVRFGAGSIRSLAAEAEQLGLRRLLVLCTPNQRPLAEQAAAVLGSAAVGIFDQAAMHVPAATADAALEVVHRQQADGCVAIGGGSTIGLAKAIALETGLPSIALPTTFAGSEATPIWGITRDGVKTTGRDLQVLPRVILYDPELSRTLPGRIAAPSALNAMAHCVEGLYAENRNPIISMLAVEGTRALATHLPSLLRDPDNLEARTQCLYGAWLAGVVLGSVGMALHHKLCHTLGGSFGLPHAEVHAVILPHATAFNAEHAPQAMQQLATALKVAPEAVPGTLHDLAVETGAPTSLAALGLPAADLERAAELATRNPYYNPGPVTREGVLALLEQAYRGQRP